MSTQPKIEFYAVTAYYKRINQPDTVQHESREPAGEKGFNAALREARQAVDRRDVASRSGNNLPNAHLQIIALGPRVQIITPDTPPPDEQSLLAFARSQGIDESLIQRILENARGDGGQAPAGTDPTSPPGERAQLENGLGERAGDEAQMGASLAALFPALFGSALAAAAIADAPWPGTPAGKGLLPPATSGWSAMPAGIAADRFSPGPPPAAAIHVAPQHAAPQPVDAVACQPSPFGLSTAAFATAASSQKLAPLTGCTDAAGQTGSPPCADDPVTLALAEAEAGSTPANGPTLPLPVEDSPTAGAAGARMPVATTADSGIDNVRVAERNGGSANPITTNPSVLAAEASTDAGNAAEPATTPTDNTARVDSGARLSIDLTGTAPGSQESMQEAHFRRSEQYQLLSERLSAAVGHRVAAEIGKGTWQLTMYLHPEHLGRINVHLGRRANGHIEAEFSTTQSNTQDLLLNGMGRLKDVMAASGLDLHLLNVRLEDPGSDGQQHASRQDVPTSSTAAARPVTDPSAAARAHVAYLGSDGLDVLA
jgi:flagellar hook-length control protein FliK